MMASVPGSPWPLAFAFSAGRARSACSLYFALNVMLQKHMVIHKRDKPNKSLVRHCLTTGAFDQTELLLY